MGIKRKLYLRARGELKTPSDFFWDKVFHVCFMSFLYAAFLAWAAMIVGVAIA